MSDFFQQFKKQQEINEDLFGSLFNKKKPQQITPDNGIEITENSDNTLSITFENGSFAKEVNTPSALPYLKQIDFNSSKFNFLNLPGTKFNATYLELNLKKQTVDIFIGDWHSGPFQGGQFEGVFNGSSFNGNFTGKYTDWESHPITFVDGTFIDTTNSGLLGMPNMITLDKARGKNFHITTIPVGYYLQFRSVNGISGYVKVLKRLDNVNSTFRFEVLDGFNGQSAQIIEMTWTQIRQSWDTLVVNPKNTKNIAGLIKVPEGDFIKELYISSAPATFQTKTLSFNPKSKYKFNISKLPYLSIETIKSEDGQYSQKPIIELSFNTIDEFKKYENIVSNINSGVFKQDIKDINKGIKYGEIDGYGPFDYLRFIFNDVKGTKLLPKSEKTRGKMFEDTKGTIHTHKFKAPDLKNDISEPGNVKIQYGAIPAMERMNDFVKYFIENIVDSSGNPNLDIQNTITSRLKTAFGTDTVKKSVDSSSKINSEPGATNISDLNTGDDKGDNMEPDDTIQGFSIKESIRNAVRGIINENF